MTARQLIIHAETLQARADIIGRAISLRIGESVVFRFPPKFALRRGHALSMLDAVSGTQVQCLRDADRVLYREYAPMRAHRKGWNEPRWRTLARLDGAV
jgi:hypothetical protein